MIYITRKIPPAIHQMTLDEFLFSDSVPNYEQNDDTTLTRTICVNYIANRLLEKVNVERMIQVLERFNESTKELRSVERRSLYRSFKIPKKSGGLRQIDAPNDELMHHLRNLKRILEDTFGLLYHTSAFAYIKERCTVDAVKRHQSNGSHWFAKLDLSNFFGSTTLDFIMKMFSMIFPMSEIVKTERGRTALETALELAILDGGLPQGTPVSPTITNIMMIPIDHALANAFRSFQSGDQKQTFVYTRYADDFLISSRYTFNCKEVEAFVVKTLADFDAPFTINGKKTRYGSSAGANWNLGVMLNKDNQITVGHKKKKQFQAMLNSYVLDRKNGNPWSLNDVQTLDGYRNYYRMVEGDVIDRIVEHMSRKLDANILAMIHEDLKS